jgi:hypothetical protein
MNKKQIDSILFGIGCDSYNRFETFLRIVPQLKGKYYWYALRNAYDVSDNLYHIKGLVKAAFCKNEPERQSLMSKKERDYLKVLPEQITIYRGMTEVEYKSGHFGISWTLKKEVADFFVHTYLRNHATNHIKKTVHELVINKSDAIAFFNGRKEFEIIYLSK